MARRIQKLLKNRIQTIRKHECQGVGRMIRTWLPGSIFLCTLLVVSQGIASPTAFNIQMEAWSPYFSPDLAMVMEGSPIRWDNPTGTHHTITHDGCGNGGFCAFNSGLIPPSGIFEVPDLPLGTYSYHCSIHPIMRGVVQVVEAGTSEI